jgi:twitching motility protein PilT
MCLMDDSLFGHYKEGRCTIEDVLAKAHFPEDLAKRIVNHKRALGEMEEDEADDKEKETA